MSAERVPVGLLGRYTADEGHHFLSGVAALVRVPLVQMRQDRARGLSTRAFISGYPGSPLGGVDLELGRRRELLAEHGIVHQPGLNEELAATAVFGSQVATVTGGFHGDGVLGVWYGKAPGLDRAADAIRHGNYAGTGAHSGVLVAVGDDPAAKSSTLPSASEGLCADLSLPVLHPGDPREVLELGLHAIALSRASGLWAALKMVTAVADATGTVSLATGPPVSLPIAGAGEHRPVARLHQPFTAPLERDLVEVRLPLAQRYGATYELNRTTFGAPDAWLGVIAPGHTYVAVLEALRVLGVEPADCGRLGVRLHQVRMPSPMDGATLRRFADGLDEVLVVEEKSPFVERQVRDALYGVTGAPIVMGKRAPTGEVVVQGWGALEADAIAEILRGRLQRRVDPSRLRPRRRGPGPQLPLLPARTPWFCSGCPHSSSTKVPAGALVGTGIGCHALASRMDPERVGRVLSNTQMGGEGAQWVGAAPFLDHGHMFQNVGDGTLFHSGWLGIRFAVAAGSTITFKVLYNGYVAMTGGQPAPGTRSVPELVRGLKAEGVGRVIITAEDPGRYKGVKLPKGTSVRPRDRILEAQRELAATPGVTVLIHDQVCAAELRRARKRGRSPTPTQRVVINSRVCEGCGDCGVKSTCLSLHPVDTEFGTKTAIHQGSCNLDLSCLEGDCPSFTLVERIGPPTGRNPHTATRADAQVAIPEPPPGSAAEVSIRLVGIGGTGVVTSAQIIGMAASLDGLTVHGVDQTGLSQKAGPVTSDLIISRAAAQRPGRISSAGVDLLVAFDLLTAAGQLGDDLVAGRTVLVANAAATPTGAMVGAPDARRPAVAELVDALERAVGDIVVIDAERVTGELLGHEASANMFLIGVAHQRGHVPVSSSAMEQAIRDNGVSVEQNLAAFEAGRRYQLESAAGPVPDGDGLEAGQPHPHLAAELGGELGEAVRALPAELRERTARLAHDLVGYQSTRYALDYLAVVRRAAGTGSIPFAEAVAANVHRLMAYKDEYEVARLHLADAARREAESAAGGGQVRVTLMLHPPLLRALGVRRKLRFGPRWRPVLRLLAAAKWLRGTPLDPVGRMHVRRIERRLRDEYTVIVDRLVEDFDQIGAHEATRIAALPGLVRGYDEVKLASIARYREALAGTGFGAGGSRADR